MPEKEKLEVGLFGGMIQYLQYDACAGRSAEHKAIPENNISNRKYRALGLLWWRSYWTRIASRASERG